ncbi:hypothetical protein HYT24_01590 [Candidatus Pacearchaeota archaeon]|nr:hypothetical protein [Candidatus Pacearchaeota archaeon]
MKVIGFNFNKVSIEKKTEDFKEIKVNAPSIDIRDIKQVKSPVFSMKEDVFEVKFTYSVKYLPDIAEVSLAGSMLLVVDQKVSKELAKEWKNKKVPAEQRLFILNIIVRKATLKAIELEDELNLPTHIHIPTIKEIKDQE